MRILQFKKNIIHPDIIISNYKLHGWLGAKHQLSIYPTIYKRDGVQKGREKYITFTGILNVFAALSACTNSEILLRF